MKVQLNGRSGIMNKAIYVHVNGKKTFVGKHIKDQIVREFDFSKAVLWQHKELSFDKNLLTYALDKKVKSFIMTNTRYKESFKYGIQAIVNNGHYMKEYGEGEQWYFSKDIGKKIKYLKTPYVKQEVILNEKEEYGIR